MESSWIKPTLTSFLLALAPLALAQPIITEIVFNVSAAATYGELYNVLRVALSDNHPRMEVQGHVVLAPQRHPKSIPPNRWINLRLQGDGDDETTLAIAEDDIYIHAFADRTGAWHSLQGSSFFPGARELPFGHTYSEMHEGGIAELPKLPLGKASALHSIKALAGYDPEKTGSAFRNERQMKRAFVKFVLMVSESLRFFPIRRSFSESWEKTNYIHASHTKYLHHWGKISSLILLWQKNGRWPGREDRVARLVAGETQVTGSTEALETVDMIIRSNGI